MDIASVIIFSWILRKSYTLHIFATFRMLFYITVVGDLASSGLELNQIKQIPNNMVNYKKKNWGELIRHQLFTVPTLTLIAHESWFKSFTKKKQK